MKKNHSLHIICDNNNLAIAIESLVEVIDHVEVDLIPNIPKYMKGIFYYKGKIVPLIDLSLRLFEKSEDLKQSRIVIIKNAGFFTGLYVNQVRMVLEYKDLYELSNLKLIKGKFQINDVEYSLLNLELILKD